MLIRRVLTGVCCILTLVVRSQELVASVEAESGALNGVQVEHADAGYSGTGYVSGFDAATDYVEVELDMDTAGLYELTIRYSAPYGSKTQYVSVNDGNSAEVTFPATATGEWEEVSSGKYLLTAGSNKLRVISYWGYMHVDQVLAYSAERVVFSIADSPVDTAANVEAIALYSFLKEHFGSRIISGQTDSYFEDVVTLTGYSPVLRGFDMQSYTSGYAYDWEDGDFAFGAVDNGQVDSAISWHETTGGAGIVSFQWHWHSPFGGEPGTNTFYSSLTTFDVRQAVIPGTPEYAAVVQDIDSVAVQLRKLQDAGVAVFWRPLHEAGGEWFWWGAYGAEPCLQLYKLMYERLLEVHQLHNLIWVWSTPEPDWYPGNDRVDMIGYDSYPGSYNYTAQKAFFDQLYTLTGGQKLIGMTENGPIPDMNDAFESDAPWGLFMSWSDLVTVQNTEDHIREVYDNWRVLVLDETYQLLIRSEPDSVEEVLAVRKREMVRVFPNPVSDELHLKSDQLQRILLFDSSGRKVLEESNPGEVISLRNIPAGHYLLWMQDGAGLYCLHLLIRH